MSIIKTMRITVVARSNHEYKIRVAWLSLKREEQFN